MAESYLADFLTAKRQIADRITLDPDVQATVVLAFMNGIRPLAPLKRLKEIPTTTLKATIARFQLITTSEAEIALINIKEGVAARRPQIDRQQQLGTYVPREGKKVLAAAVVEQQPPPQKRPLCANRYSRSSFAKVP